MYLHNGLLCEAKVAQAPETSDTSSSAHEPGSSEMTRELPPLVSARAFEAAARRLSFQGAAEELHVTPSAISHRVRSLESFLGVELFRRNHRGVALTMEGHAYMAKLQLAFDVRMLTGAANDKFGADSSIVEKARNKGSR